MPYITPVLPSQDIARDCAWYVEKLAFAVKQTDEMYAVLSRDNLWLHLQWHADTESDPLLGGSVIKIFVDEIEPWFAEISERAGLPRKKLRRNTDWGTHEFGLYDLNGNAIFFVQDVY